MMEAWADQPAKRDNRWFSARCARGLFSEDVLSNSGRAKHDLSHPERSILKLLPSAARWYHRLLFQVTVKRQIAILWTLKVGSSYYICCVINIRSFLTKKLTSPPLLFCPTIIAVVTWQLQPLQHLNELRLRWWRCPWLHAGGSPTILKYALG